MSGCHTITSRTDLPGVHFALLRIPWPSSLFMWCTPSVELAYSDTFWNQVMLHTVFSVFAVLPFPLIVFSYTQIFRAMMKMPSVLGRRKAFSTCSSHLGVVTLFYGLAMVVYFKWRSRDSADTDKYLAVFYTILTPMLNPVIYSLRNKEVRIALKRLLWRKRYCRVCEINLNSTKSPQKVFGCVNIDVPY